MTDSRPLVDLPDLNLWLALAWSRHRHHATHVQAALLEQPGVRLVDDAAASWPVFRQLAAASGRPGSARTCIWRPLRSPRAGGW